MDLLKINDPHKNSILCVFVIFFFSFFFSYFHCKVLISLLSLFSFFTCILIIDYLVCPDFVKMKNFAFRCKVSSVVCVRYPVCLSLDILLESVQLLGQQCILVGHKTFLFRFCFAWLASISYVLVIFVRCNGTLKI